MKTKTYISTLLFLALLLSALQYFQFIDIYTADVTRVAWCSLIYIFISLLSDILQKKQLADLHFPLVYFFPVLLFFFVGDNAFTDLCLAIFVSSIPLPLLKKITTFADKYWLNNRTTVKEAENNEISKKL